MITNDEYFHHCLWIFMKTIVAVVYETLAALAALQLLDKYLKNINEQDKRVFLKEKHKKTQKRR